MNYNPINEKGTFGRCKIITILIIILFKIIIIP